MSKPLRIAIVGFGNHVRKNILSCLQGNPDYELAAIHVRRAGDRPGTPPELAALFTESLDTVLGDATLDVVYIATPLSTHFGYALAALEAGKHVWCEKPMTDALERTAALVDKAAAGGLLIGEVAMYQHHAQFAWLRSLIAEKAAAGDTPIGVRARFSIPRLDKGDIRYSRPLSGGALFDVGYYPASAALALFGTPTDMLAAGHISPEFDVDLSGGALFAYPDFPFHASWAIGGSYANEIEISFPGCNYFIPRAFSKPPDLSTEVGVTDAFGATAEPIPISADNQFRNIFSDFSAVIRAEDAAAAGRYGQRSLETARLLQRVYDQVYGRSARS